MVAASVSSGSFPRHEPDVLEVPHGAEVDEPVGAGREEAEGEGGENACQQRGHPDFGTATLKKYQL